MKRELEVVELAAVQSQPPSRLHETVVVLTLVFAWVLACYWPTASDIAAIWWRSDTFAHGLLVIPIAAWLVWRKRDRIALLAPDPVPWMVVPVAAFGVGWLLGELVHVAAAAQLSLVGMIVTSLAAALGWKLSRALLFPLLFLFFGVPIGEFLLPTMMAYTADFTVSALRATGVPVYREGMQFVIPNGSWSVVEACSGLRYLIASLMVGALYAYLNFATLSRRLRFMAVALLVPIVANWVRAYLTVMIGYKFGNEFVAGFIHIVYGWVFFGLVIFIMFWIGSRWRETPPAESVISLASAALSNPYRRGGVVALLALVVVAFPLALAGVERPVQDFTVEIALPSPSAGWRTEDGAFTYRPHFTGQRGEALGIYRGPDGGKLALHIAYFAEQQAGSEMVMWGNGLVSSGEQRSSIVSAGHDVMPPGEVRHAVLQAREGRFEVWHWYWINGRVVTRDEWAKILLAANILAGRNDDSAHVAVIVPLEGDSGSARTRAADFLSANWSALASALDAAGAGRQ